MESEEPRQRRGAIVAVARVRLRGLDRVRLPADLTILAKLACPLARERVQVSRGVATRPTIASLRSRPHAER